MHTHEDDDKNNKYFIIGLLLAFLLFIAGYFYTPLFIAAYLVSGLDVLQKSVKQIIKGHVFDEYFLMSIATAGALYLGEYPEAVMVMILYKLGEYLQDKAVDNSYEKIEKLLNYKTDFVIINGEKIAPEDAKPGDIFTIRSGEKIPLDGIVTEGQASIDTSSITGEALPTNVVSGDTVYAGTINTSGFLKIKVTKKFEDTTAAKIIEFVHFASDKKAKTEKFITKFAKYYTPIVVLLAVIIAFLPENFLNINRPVCALTFLVISCPCALVISVPLTFFAAVGSSSSSGILIKGSNFIETLSKTKVAVFDKTGTLTESKLTLTEINSDYPEILELAAIAEQASIHPTALAIKEKYANNPPFTSNIKEVPGLGIIAEYKGRLIKIGNASFVNVAPINKDGLIIYISVDGNYAGYFVFKAEIKREANLLSDNLKKMGIKSVILSGDSEKNTSELCKELNFNAYFAELMPMDKVEVFDNIKSESSGTVIYTGDGINDAPVIMRADVGIAMGGLGSDAAIEAANVVIMDDNPLKVIKSITISKMAMAVVYQNIIFALSVKILFMLLTAYGLMTMWGAVFADVGVTLIAVLNSLRLSKVK